MCASSQQAQLNCVMAERRYADGTALWRSLYNVLCRMGVERLINNPKLAGAGEMTG